MGFQQGSFILFCLVIISALTSLSLLSMQSSIQSSRLVHSYKSYNLAFRRAEVALQIAEDQLDTQSDYALDRTNKPLQRGLFPALLKSGATSQPCWQFISKKNLWLDEKYTIIQRLNLSKNLLFSNINRSAYIIEKLSIDNTVEAVEWFRVTAKGFGLEANTAVILQVVLRVENTAPAKKQRVSWRKI